MKKYSVFSIGKHTDKNSDYFDDQKNKEVLHKVAQKCYLPTNKILLELIEKHAHSAHPFKVSFSITGVLIEQLVASAPEVLESFQKLAATGCVEFLAETYYHSLSFLYSKNEFKAQVEMHRKMIKQYFGQEPTVFRNTELIYNNELAHDVEEMGFSAILAEGADHILGWKSPNYVYSAKTTKNLKLLLKNYKLSDDIAFRFGQKSWSEYPLHAHTFAQWIAQNDGHSVNLFMDYETFGEHQWSDTGIFEFLKVLPKHLSAKNIHFVTVSELAALPAVAELDIHNFVSWADIERDLSAWTGNSMQNSALTELYALEPHVKKLHDRALLQDWRRLTTSDHYYYMCTKYFNDGDVHKYFNPYDTPYESYINFMNILNDIIERMKRIIAQRSMTHDLTAQHSRAHLKTPDPEDLMSMQ